MLQILLEQERLKLKQDTVDRVARRPTLTGGATNWLQQIKTDVVTENVGVGKRSH